jgi:hypothetical protein
MQKKHSCQLVYANPTHQNTNYTSLFDSNITLEMNQNWKRFLQKRPESFNSKLLRVIQTHIVQTPDEIITQIQVIPDIWYKDIISLRYLDGVESKKIDPKITCNALSSYIFVKTSDNIIIFTERNCGDWEHALDSFGGFIQERYNITHVEDFVKNRFYKDIQIDSEYIKHNPIISNITFLGLFDFDAILEKMTIYCINVNCDFAQLQKIAKVTLIAVPNTYTTTNHSKHFKLRLHKPLYAVLERYLEQIKHA